MKRALVAVAVVGAMLALCAVWLVRAPGRDAVMPPPVSTVPPSAAVSPQQIGPAPSAPSDRPAGSTAPVDDHALLDSQISRVRRFGVGAAPAVSAALITDEPLVGRGPLPVAVRGTPPTSAEPAGPSPYTGQVLAAHADAIAQAADLARQGQPERAAVLLEERAESASRTDHDRLLLVAVRLLADHDRLRDARALLDGATWKDSSLGGEVEAARARLRKPDSPTH